MRSNISKRLGAVILSAAMAGSGAFAVLSSAGVLQAEAASATVSTDYGLADTSQKGVILHCWNWSYKNIKKYMKDIAAAGYTSVQTSPVQQPKDYYWKGVAYGNVGIPDGTGGYEGNWWKLYQPVTFSICDNGHTWLGNKQEFKEMCAEAEKYGVKVIVDIVANHMGNIQGYKIGDEETVMGDISPQVGEFWEPKMLTDPSYWHISTSWTHTSDGRFDVTQGNMGMPDLNTGDSKVQQMVLGLLKECIDCGADGFRFDAAKHIETPADDKAFASDFWDVVLDGAKSYYKKVNGNENIYFYGEVLNRLDDSNAEAYYRSKMSLTDNSTSDNLRNSVIHGQVSALASSGYCGYIAGQGTKAVLWAESHDTYMGGGSSYDANDRDIKRTWAIIASRKDSTGLFFARPYYSKDILAGDVSKARQSYATILENVGGDQTQIGDVGSLTWADKDVVEVNRFRNYFVGQSEKLGASGNTAYNVRGKTGIVIVRGEGPGAVSLNVGMTDGTYYDQVTGEKFTVKNGTITGNITGEDAIAVIYNPSKNYGAVNPEKPAVLKISAETGTGETSFDTTSVNITMNVQGAATATYTTSEGVSGTFTSASKTLSIGNLTATGEDVTVSITATAKDGISKTKSFIFTKTGQRSGYPELSSAGVVFDNAEYDWAEVYCYIYDSNKVNNAGWPGVKMTDVGGGYWTYKIPETFSGTVYVIFNNNSGVQYPSGEGLTMQVTEKKLFTNKVLTDLPASSKSLKVTLTPSVVKAGINQAVKLTAKVSDASGTVKYTFLTSDGQALQTSGTANSVTWTPTKAGTYIAAVTAADSGTSYTATAQITVSGTSTELINQSKISATSGTVGKAVKITAVGAGGTTPYTYEYYYKLKTASSWTTLQKYSTTATASFTPKTAGIYNICVKVKDKNGTIAKAYFDYTASASVLTNNSTQSAKSINLGSSITLKGAASGGKAPYTYAYYYRALANENWSTLKGFSTTASVTFQPKTAEGYKLCVKVKDAAGKVEKKYMYLSVNSVMKNNSSISSTSISKGSTLTLKGAASGGTSPYQYAYYYKKTSSDTWSGLGGFSTASSKTLKLSNTGTYDICIKAKDASGNVVKKYFTVTVK